MAVQSQNKLIIKKSNISNTRQSQQPKSMRATSMKAHSKDGGLFIKTHYDRQQIQEVSPSVVKDLFKVVNEGQHND